MDWQHKYYVVVSHKSHGLNVFLVALVEKVYLDTKMINSTKSLDRHLISVEHRTKDKSNCHHGVKLFEYNKADMLATLWR